MISIYGNQRYPRRFNDNNNRRNDFRTVFTRAWVVKSLAHTKEESDMELFMLSIIITASYLHLSAVLNKRMYGVSTKEAIRIDISAYPHVTALSLIPIMNIVLLFIVILAVAEMRDNKGVGR